MNQAVTLSRWIFFIPAGILSGWLAYILATIWFYGSHLSEMGSGPNIVSWIAGTIGLSAGFFYGAYYVMPVKKKNTIWILFSISALISTLMIVASIIQSNWSAITQGVLFILIILLLASEQIKKIDKS